jgi:hypothetical protein
MARFLDDKIGRQQAAVRRARTRRQEKSTMGSGRRCVHEGLSGYAFVYAKVSATIRLSVSTKYYVGTTRQRLICNAAAF